MNLMQTLNLLKRYEFAQEYYDKVCKSLEIREMWEELAWFKLGVELCVRQNELLSIRYSQIDFPMVKNIKILKKRSPDDEAHYYDDKRISTGTHQTILKIRPYYSPNDAIFNHPAQYYSNCIKSIVGGLPFNNCFMRTIGTIFLWHNVSLMGDD